MAHKEQIEFCTSVKNKFPQYFSNIKVLDCGSLDINGNNRYLFTDCNYLGIDVGPGLNVDVVSMIHEFNAPDQSYDTIISTECFEHDQYYQGSIMNIIRMLKPGGLLLFTCATTGRSEHGTRRTSPQDAPLLNDEWADYYKNLTEEDIRDIIDIDKEFDRYEFSVNDTSHDLYFWGIKK